MMLHSFTKSDTHSLYKPKISVHRFSLQCFRVKSQQLKHQSVSLAPSVVCDFLRFLCRDRSGPGSSRGQQGYWNGSSDGPATSLIWLGSDHGSDWSVSQREDTSNGLKGMKRERCWVPPRSVRRFSVHTAEPCSGCSSAHSCSSSCLICYHISTNNTHFLLTHLYFTYP